MLIKVTKPSDVLGSEVTDQGVYLDRRRFLKAAAIAGAGLSIAPSLLLSSPAQAGKKWPG